MCSCQEEEPDEVYIARCLVSDEEERKVVEDEGRATLGVRGTMVANGVDEAEAAKYEVYVDFVNQEEVNFFSLVKLSSLFSLS
jgi:hypothetical protein